MVNKELIRVLLKELEREKGCPVQIRVDTQASERYSNDGPSREYFGKFENRGAIIRRVSSLDPKYEHDVSLMGGEYASLNDLNKMINKYIILYRIPALGTDVDKVFDLIHKLTNKPLTIGGWNSTEKPRQEEVKNILNDNGLFIFITG